MELGLRDRVALVAASSKGLGRAVALGLAQEGAKVIITSRHPDNLEKAERLIRTQTDAQVLSVQADLNRTDDIQRLVAAGIDAFGTIDVLVNNAGGPPPGTFLDLHDEAWLKGFELTLMSSVRLTRHVLQGMQKQKWGRIINITSFSVKQPIDDLLLSNSLRLSILGWAKTLSNQVAPDGVLINNVCPGWTRTERVEQLFQAKAEAANSTPEAIEEQITATIPMSRLASPEEFANLVVFLASERASYITGTAIQIDGGTVQGYY